MTHWSRPGSRWRSSTSRTTSTRMRRWPSGPDAYLQAHPNLKAIGTQHGNSPDLRRSLRPQQKRAISLSAASTLARTIDGITKGFTAWLRPGAVPARYYPVQQVFMTKNYLIRGCTSIPGRHRHAQNIAQIAPLIEQAFARPLAVRQACPARSETRVPSPRAQLRAGEARVGAGRPYRQSPPQRG